MCWFPPGESLRARVHSNFLMLPALYMLVCLCMHTFYVSKAECMSVHGVHEVGEKDRVSVCVCGREAVTFFFFFFSLYSWKLFCSIA